jgi:hypothetical protein
MLWHSYFTIFEERREIYHDLQCVGLGKLHKQREERQVVNKTPLKKIGHFSSSGRCLYSIRRDTLLTGRSGTQWSLCEIQKFSGWEGQV